MRVEGAEWKAFSIRRITLGPKILGVNEAPRFTWPSRLGHQQITTATLGLRDPERREGHGYA